MSHTAIPGFCVRLRPRCPLGGGNVAALQHEGRVRSGRPARSSGAEARGSRRPSVRKGPRGAEAGEGSRRPAGRSSSPLLLLLLLLRGWPTGSPAPHELRRRRRQGSPAPSVGAGGGAGSGRVRTPRHLAGVSATRAGPDPQAGTDRARRYPGEARGSRLAGSWSLDARAPRPRLLSTPAASPQGRPPEGRISGTAAAALGGRGGGGGGVGWETGPEVEGEAWRPRAGSAAASTTRGQRGELRLCQTRQETFRPCQRRPP